MDFRSNANADFSSLFSLISYRVSPIRRHVTGDARRRSRISGRQSAGNERSVIEGSATGLGVNGGATPSSSSSSSGAIVIGSLGAGKIRFDLSLNSGVISGEKVAISD